MQRLFGVPAGLALTLALAPAESARAGCNVIPGATEVFRGATGSTNRPFAGPDDYVEVRVRPAICDGKSTGFVDRDEDGEAQDDYVVTVLFVPPNGPANAVVLAEDCGGISLASCNAQLSPGTAACVQLNAPDPAPPTELVVEDLSTLQVRFPDTDARVDAANDDRTLTGPMKW